MAFSKEEKKRIGDLIKEIETVHKDIMDEVKPRDGEHAVFLDDRKSEALKLLFEQEEALLKEFHSIVADEDL